MFVQNIGCEYPKSMFGSKIRKIDIQMHTPILLYKSGVYKGVYITRTCYHDGDTKNIKIKMFVFQDHFHKMH